VPTALLLSSYFSVSLPISCEYQALLQIGPGQSGLGGLPGKDGKDGLNGKDGKDRMTGPPGTVGGTEIYLCHKECVGGRVVSVESKCLVAV